MLGIIITLALVTFLFWLGYRITGAILSAVIWLCIKVPFAIILCCIGILCCVTLLLIPIGWKCIKYAWKVIFY